MQKHIIIFGQNFEIMSLWPKLTAKWILLILSDLPLAIETETNVLQNWKVKFFRCEVNLSRYLEDLSRRKFEPITALIKIFSCCVIDNKNNKQSISHPFIFKSALCMIFSWLNLMVIQLMLAWKSVDWPSNWLNWKMCLAIN